MVPASVATSRLRTVPHAVVIRGIEHRHAGPFWLRQQYSALVPISPPSLTSGLTLTLTRLKY